MFLRRSDHNLDRKRASLRSGDSGFTILETAIALVILMIIGLGIASLFLFATQANTRADDRELSIAIAQKRMEWLRSIPFTTQTRSVAFSYPNGGLAATSTSGVTETVQSAGRSYEINTVITDLSFVPAGNPDSGAPTSKTIRLSVTPLGVKSFGTITVYTQRSTQVVGNF
jgi:type II secretory pathway pseudopilin PulG